LRVDINAAGHLKFSVGSSDHAFGLGKASLRRSIVATVVLHHPKQIFIRDHEHVGVGVHRDGGETRIGITDGADRSPIDNNGFAIRLALHENPMTQPHDDAAENQSKRPNLSNTKSRNHDDLPSQLMNSSDY